MTKRHKNRIRVEIDVHAMAIGADSLEPDHAEPTQVALHCVSVIIHAIEHASEAAAKGDKKPTIPSGMPVDLVTAPGVVHSFTWRDLLEAEQALGQE
ncbi:MAG: hypothetical protein WAP74_00550 [Patescibacteria group bacterium]